LWSAINRNRVVLVALALTRLTMSEKLQTLGKSARRVKLTRQLSGLSVGMAEVEARRAEAKKKTNVRLMEERMFAANVSKSFGRRKIAQAREATSKRHEASRELLELHDMAVADAESRTFEEQRAIEERLRRIKMLERAKIATQIAARSAAVMARERAAAEAEAAEAHRRQTAAAAAFAMRMRMLEVERRARKSLAHQHEAEENERGMMDGEDQRLRLRARAAHDAARAAERAAAKRTRARARRAGRVEMQNQSERSAGVVRAREVKARALAYAPPLPCSLAPSPSPFYDSNDSDDAGSFGSFNRSTGGSGARRTVVFTAAGPIPVRLPATPAAEARGGVNATRRSISPRDAQIDELPTPRAATGPVSSRRSLDAGGGAQHLLRRGARHTDDGSCFMHSGDDELGAIIDGGASPLPRTARGGSRQFECERGDGASPYHSSARTRAAGSVAAFSRWWHDGGNALPRGLVKSAGGRRIAAAPCGVDSAGGNRCGSRVVASADPMNAFFTARYVLAETAAEDTRAGPDGAAPTDGAPRRRRPRAATADERPSKPMTRKSSSSATVGCAGEADVTGAAENGEAMMRHDGSGSTSEATSASTSTPTTARSPSTSMLLPPMGSGGSHVGIIERATGEV
jgi:hypothetical protein